jgi:hypothetical protein
MSTDLKSATAVEPGSFEPANHFYPRALNAQIHPTVAHFLNLSVERVLKRYCHMHPKVDPLSLGEILRYQPKHFPWFGSDLIHVVSPAGMQQMVVIETNSCPSGQKSMPLLHETVEEGSYRRLVEECFMPLASNKRLPKGDLCVLYDKNPMENTGYASTIATVSGERVWLTPFDQHDPDPPARFVDGVLEVRDEGGDWHPIRASFRYVTQRPWTRIPIQTKTLIVNPTLACISGGRNKMLAAKAYDFYNGELRRAGLSVRTPETIWDVGHREVPLWVRRWGGLAVVKNPYSNAGQGVWTLTNEEELEAFMALEQPYDKFIVQSLIGNYRWSSDSGIAGRIYHVGTVPDKREETFAADVRVMVCSTPDGFRPLAIYARRAREALTEALPAGQSSWGMLGTNLSVKRPDGGFDTQQERLLLMDRRDFNLLGLGIDDLVEAFVQTILSGIAIDRMAASLMTQKNTFRQKLFRQLNDDPALIDEIKVS